MADGAAYVRVQARTSLFSARSVSSGGLVGGSYILEWTFANGFTDWIGWTLAPVSLNPNQSLPPITITPVYGNVEATNSAISNALSGKNYLYIQYVIERGCASAI